MRRQADRRRRIVVAAPDQRCLVSLDDSINISSALCVAGIDTGWRRSQPAVGPLISAVVASWNTEDDVKIHGSKALGSFRAQAHAKPRPSILEDLA